MAQHHSDDKKVFSSGRAVLLALAMLAASVAVIITSPRHVAGADTAPTGTLPATVSADALPTVQINGVVWAQVTVGNTVYATGDFSKARPAGVKAGGAGEVARGNLLAYNITTGVLSTTFVHSLNAEGLAIAASPDGSTIYVGGEFTQVDGVAHGGIAAFSTATGALVSTFKASVNKTVATVTASSSAVYVGGNFTTASGVARTDVAAFTPAGSLLTWAPKVNSSVTAMVVSGDGARVIIGGKFTTLNGVSRIGIGGVDPVTAANTAWDANFPIQDSGSSAWVTSLSADSKQVYGTAYYYTVGGNFEGRFAIDPDTGTIAWMNSCHGDSYSAFPIGNVLYSASHEHDCSDIGAFTQDATTIFASTHHYSAAETTYATGHLHTPIFIYGNGTPGPTYYSFAGQPDSTQLDWYPTLTQGTFTGQFQADWSVTGNSSYVSLGGEFPTVNGVAQQGLVRFAISSIAPNKIAPQAASTLTPTVTSLTAGSLKVSWQATWDQDNTALTYALYRDGASTPIHTATVDSTFSDRPAIGFDDTGLVPGSSHTYTVKVTDPSGNSVTGAASAAASVGSAVPSSYAATILADSPAEYWPLSEPSGSAAYDNAGYSNLNLGSDVTLGAPGPVKGSTAASFTGKPIVTTTTTTMNGQTVTSSTTNSNSFAYTTATVPPAGNTYSVEAWVKTTSKLGGAFLDYGTYTNAESATQDRVLYMDNSGHIYFGIDNDDQAKQTVKSANTYNDGTWHLVTATTGSAGSTLYVDGTRVASDASMTDTSIFDGYWRIGGDGLESLAEAGQFLWPSEPTNGYLAGSIGQVAVYPSTLTATQVSAHLAAATGTTTPPANTPPTAAFTATPSGLSASFDASASTAGTGSSIASYGWSYGDSTIGTGATSSHTYASANTYTVTLTVTDADGLTNSVSHPVTVTAGTAGSVLAQDTFNRTSKSSFGTADTGGAWTSIGTSADLSVAPGAGKIAIGTQGGVAGGYLGSVSTASTEVTASIALDKVPAGGTDSLYVLGRRTGTNAEYRARIRIAAGGAVSIAVTKLDGSSTEVAVTPTVTVSGLNYTAGTVLNVKFDLTGTGAVTAQAKVWASTATEPTGWQVSGTDTATTVALQGAGSVGVRANVSSGVSNVPLTWSISSFEATSLS